MRTQLSSGMLHTGTASMQHVCTDAWTTDMDASGCCWSNHTISHVTNQPLVTTKKQAIESWANKLTAWLTSVQCSHMCVKKNRLQVNDYPVRTHARTNEWHELAHGHEGQKVKKKRAIVKSSQKCTRTTAIHAIVCKGENSKPCHLICK